MDDLVTWLRQQIDATEADTRELLYWAQQTTLTLRDPKLLGKHIPGWHDWPKVEKLCQERLAELDAKRRVLAWLEEARGWAQDNSQWAYDDTDAYKALALPHADRPGYREEWRP